MRTTGPLGRHGPRGGRIRRASGWRSFAEECASSGASSNDGIGRSTSWPPARADIERELYLRLRDLFSLQVDLALYDLTSTYFEGQGPPALGAHGHSRDGKPRNRQVLVGVVMVDGWPITHRVGRRRHVEPSAGPLKAARGRSSGFTSPVRPSKHEADPRQEV
jgi:hypothetical protein